jgi:hypothetical protein
MSAIYLELPTAFAHGIKERGMAKKKSLGFNITRVYIGKPVDIERLKELQRRLLSRTPETKKRNAA